MAFQASGAREENNTWTQMGRLSSPQTEWRGKLLDDDSVPTPKLPPEAIDIAMPPAPEWDKQLVNTIINWLRGISS